CCGASIITESQPQITRILSLKQRSLGGRAAKGRSGGGLVRALFVETETLGVDFEQAFGCFPVLTFSAHAFTKDARIEFAIARLANSIQDTIGFSRQFLAQTLLEVRRNIARQAQH